MEWINVKEKLPDNNDDMLITDSYDGYTVGYWNGLRWCAQDDLLDASNYDGGCHIEIGQEITHWMPLPKPPKQH